MSVHPDEPTESTPENTEPDPPEQPDTREQPDDREPPEPAEDQPNEAKVIELHTARGSLTIRPNQTSLDGNQVAALVAIGIDVRRDPLVEPHIRPFIHMCQVKGLDPWAREAYLIGRGKGDYRKFTMQTGIDGYRKIANGTGRFIRVKETLWTGADDDDRSYVAVDDGKGGVIMRRRWYDQWPASRGFPGAAKVVIEHYDEFGNVVETDAVADWAMYAPFSDKYTGYGQNRAKVIDPETKEPVQELNDMWKKGYAHMLAKCAEALAHRKAFPASMSGVFTHEEMHRADQQERDRLVAEQRTARQQAYAASVSAPAPASELAATPAPADPEAPAGPMPLADDVAAVMAESPQSTAPADQDPPKADQDAPEPDQPLAEETRVEWLMAELAFQADVLDVTVTRLATRDVRALRKNIEDFTAVELLTMAARMRPSVAERLTANGREDDARVYAAVAADKVVDMDTLFVADGEIVPDTDPYAEHEYDEKGGECGVCGLPEAVGPHPE